MRPEGTGRDARDQEQSVTWPDFRVRPSVHSCEAKRAMNSHLHVAVRPGMQQSIHVRHNHCSHMLLRLLQVTATSLPISTDLVPHASVAEDSSIDMALTSRQPLVRTTHARAMLQMQPH